MDAQYEQLERFPSAVRLLEVLLQLLYYPQLIVPLGFRTRMTRIALCTTESDARYWIFMTVSGLPRKKKQ
jgi:hypothetical protein